jgi:hypothetical protein
MELADQCRLTLATAIATVSIIRRKETLQVCTTFKEVYSFLSGYHSAVKEKNCEKMNRRSCIKV